MAGNLLTADGAIHSELIEQHAREFTLDYLRHTILGTPRGIDSESVHGPLIISASRQKILSPADEKLVVTPDEQEKKEYGAKATKPAARVERLEEGFLLKRFQSHFQKANVAGIISSQLELLRTAISIQMERVLDATQTKDADAFDIAYKELETTMTVGFKTLLPNLTYAGVPLNESEKAFQELVESSIGTAIDKRAATMDHQKERDHLSTNYEDLLNAYQEKRLHFSEEVAQQRKIVGARLKEQEPKSKPLHSSLSCMRWEGKNLMPKAPKYRWADNNNESRH